MSKRAKITLWAWGILNSAAAAFFGFLVVGGYLGWVSSSEEYRQIQARHGGWNDLGPLVGSAVTADLNKAVFFAALIGIFAFLLNLAGARQLYQRRRLGYYLCWLSWLPVAAGTVYLCWDFKLRPSEILYSYVPSYKWYYVLYAVVLTALYWLADVRGCRPAESVPASGRMLPHQDLF